MTDWYEFRAERLGDVITKAAGGVIDENDLPEDWDNVVTDGSEWALLVTQEALAFVSVPCTRCAETGRTP